MPDYSNGWRLEAFVTVFLNKPIQVYMDALMIFFFFFCRSTCICVAMIMSSLIWIVDYTKGIGRFTSNPHSWVLHLHFGRFCILKIRHGYYWLRCTEASLLIILDHWTRLILQLICGPVDHPKPAPNWAYLRLYLDLASVSLSLRQLCVSSVVCMDNSAFIQDCNAICC